MLYKYAIVVAVVKRLRKEASASWAVRPPRNGPRYLSLLVETHDLCLAIARFILGHVLGAADNAKMDLLHANTRTHPSSDGLHQVRNLYGATKGLTLTQTRATLGTDLPRWGITLGDMTDDRLEQEVRRRLVRD
jgi:hypothetical protein